MTSESIHWDAAPPGALGLHRAAVAHRTGGISEGPFRSLNVGRSVPDSPEAVAANEQRLLAALGLPDRVARLRLEHGARVLTVAEAGMYGPADALLTDRADLVLWFTVADCYAVTISAGRWRGHAHCGWRSSAAGLLEEVCAELARRSGHPPAEMRAWIGPGIAPCCYPVGPEVVAAFPAEVIERTSAGPPRLNLAADLERRLRALGLPAAAVTRSSRCTSCHPELFFSHRRDGSPSGRMAALCWPVALEAAAVSKSSR